MPSESSSEFLDWYHRTAGRISAWLSGAGMQQATVVAEALRTRASGTADGAADQAKAYEAMARKIGTIWGSSIASLMGAIGNSFSGNIARLAGTQGGLGMAGLQLGSIFGKSAGASLGAWMGGREGKAIGVSLGILTGRGIVSVLQSAESIRVIGARFAPVMSGGMSGRSDYFNQGAELVSRQAELQMATGASQPQVMEYAQRLAQLGLGFGASGREAAQMALASEKVLALSPGDMLSLTDVAISKHGEAWRDVGDIIAQVATASEQWRRVAGSTGNSVAAALGANQVMVNIYKGVAQRAQGSSLNLAGLARVTVSLTNTMGKMGGMRPGQMAGLVPEIAKVLVPDVHSIVGSYTQSFFLADILGRTQGGRIQLDQLRGIASDKGYDPTAISIPLMMQLAGNSGATEATFRNVIMGIGATRDSLAGGDVVTKNVLTQAKMEKQFGVSPMMSRAMISMYDQYNGEIDRGFSPEDAWQRAGSAPGLRRDLDVVGPGVTIEDIVHQSAQMGMAGLSAEQKLSLGVQTWVRFAGDYWSNFRSEGKALFDAAAERVMTSVSPSRAAAAVAPPWMPSAKDPGMGGVGGNVTAGRASEIREALIREMTGDTSNPYKITELPVGDTVRSTARGIEQTTTSVAGYDSYFRDFGDELGVDPDFLKRQTAVESGGNSSAVSSAGAMGAGQIMPDTWKMLAPRMQQRFPGEKLDPMNPKHSIYGQALYMHDMLGQSGGNYQVAASKYNAGPRGNLNNPETSSYRQKLFGSRAQPTVEVAVR